MKSRYSSFFLVVVSLFLITSIIGCNKATTSTTTTPPPTTTTTTASAQWTIEGLAPPPTTTTTTTTTPPPKTSVISTSTTNTTIAQIPTFTPLVRVSAGDYEQLYSQEATTLNSTKTSGRGNYWTVTVIRAGYFSTQSSGNTINYLRIDMQVFYTSGEAVAGTFSGLGSIVVSSPYAQYQFDSVDSALNVADRFFDFDSPPVTGYWIFQVQGTLASLDTAQLSFTGGNNTGTQWLFQL